MGDFVRDIMLDQVGAARWGVVTLGDALLCPH